MSSGELQEMETGTKESKTAVNANAQTGDKAIPKLTTGGTAPTWQDLGGPTVDNYKPDNDSAKLSSGSGVKQVSDVVTNRKGKTGAMAAQKRLTLSQAMRPKLRIIRK